MHNEQVDKITKAADKSPPIMFDWDTHGQINQLTSRLGLLSNKSLNTRIYKHE